MSNCVIQSKQKWEPINITTVQYTRLATHSLNDRCNRELTSSNLINSITASVTGIKNVTTLDYSCAQSWGFLQNRLKSPLVTESIPLGILRDKLTNLFKMNTENTSEKARDYKQTHRQVNWTQPSQWTTPSLSVKTEPSTLYWNLSIASAPTRWT